jgi:predicted transcriptional regulator
MRLQDDNASFRFNQTGLRKFLGDLECEIMELVWKKTSKDSPMVTVRDIFDTLRKHREIAYTTVMTTMVRLSEKGILRIVDKAGLANCYSAVDSRKDFIQKNVFWVLNKFAKEFPEDTQDWIADKSSRRSGSRR